MPVTPAQAIVVSPAAKMSNDEKIALTLAKDKIDEYLRSGWEGSPWQIKCPPMTQRTTSHLIRAYEQHDWRVTAQPIDGALAPAVELLRSGGAPEWMVSFMPRWTSEE